MPPIIFRRLCERLKEILNSQPSFFMVMELCWSLKQRSNQVVDMIEGQMKQTKLGHQIVFIQLLDGLLDKERKAKDDNFKRTISLKIKPMIAEFAKNASFQELAILHKIISSWGSSNLFCSKFVAKLKEIIRSASCSIDMSSLKESKQIEVFQLREFSSQISEYQQLQKHQKMEDQQKNIQYDQIFTNYQSIMGFEITKLSYSMRLQRKKIQKEWHQINDSIQKTQVLQQNISKNQSKTQRQSRHNDLLEKLEAQKNNLIRFLSSLYEDYQTIRNHFEEFLDKREQQLKIISQTGSSIDIKQVIEEEEESNSKKKICN